MQGVHITPSIRAVTGQSAILWIACGQCYVLGCLDLSKTGAELSAGPGMAASLHRSEARQTFITGAEARRLRCGGVRQAGALDSRERATKTQGIFLGVRSMVGTGVMSALVGSGHAGMEAMGRF